MSKHMNRIAFSILISLVVVAGLYTSVLGASLNVGTSRGAVRVNAGLLVDASRARGATSLNAYYSDVARPAQFHDCSGGDSAFDPND